MFSDIEAQKKAYQDELDKQNAEIDKQNAEITNQNELLKSAYDKAVSDIKTINIEQYISYYYTIPNTIRDLFQTPEQLNQQIADDKIQRINDISNNLDNQYNKWNAKYIHYDELYNKESDGDKAIEYDRLRYEAEVFRDTVVEARAYATGDYTMESIDNFIGDKAQARIDRNWQLVAEDRLVKIQEQQQIEEYKKQGLEPVYKYPKSQLQELIGFTPKGTTPDTSSWYAPVISKTSITSSKIIPQSKISLGLNKAQIPQEQLDIFGQQVSQQYINQFGQPISYQKSYYLNPPKVITPFAQSELGKVFGYGGTGKSVLGDLSTFPKSTKPVLNITKIKSPIKRGTIGLPEYSYFLGDIGKPKPLEEFVISGVEGLSTITTKGYERLFTENLKMPLTTDIFFNVPYQTRGTMITNPSTLKYELPTPQKATTLSFAGITAKVLGTAPEIALWTFVPEVIAAPYVVRGTKTALNPSLTPTQRVMGGIETGGALAFGYGRGITKLIPKQIKELVPRSKIILETTKLEVPAREGVLGVKQVNPVDIYENIYGRQLTKYNYQVKSIIPEITKSTGKVTKVYKQSIWGDFIGAEPKLIYSGVPYTDKVAYKEAINQLKLFGSTEKQAKNLIRLTAPKYAESRVTGEAYALFGEDLLKPISKLKAEQKITPKIIEISGVKTRSFQPVDYFIKSKGVEAGSKGDILFYKSFPEYTKTYMTKEGRIFQKLKQAGKTTEVFEQLTGLKSLGERELKLTVNDIGYARTYVPKELEAFKDVSISRKIIPKERKLLYSKGNILTSNLEEPIIITHEAPFKITKEIKTGTVTGFTGKRQVLQQEFKPLSLVNEAKNNLFKEQQRISQELVQQQVPQVLIELSQVKLKPVEIIKTKQLPKSSLGIMTGKFQDLTGQGKMGSLTGSGKFGDIGVLEGRFGTSLAPTEKEENRLKYVNANLFKDDLEDLTKVKTPQKERTRLIFKQPQQPKFKERQQYKQNEQFKLKQPQTFKQPEVFKTPTTTNIPRTPEDKIPRTPKLPPIFKERQSKKISEDFLKAFTVLIRSKGKIQEIGWNLPKGKALKLGVEKSKSSLAQTFALREAGTTRSNDIFYRVPANLFTQPKRARTRITPITFVERRGKTLTHYPEVKGLQQSKKIKQKNLKWL